MAIGVQFTSREQVTTAYQTNEVETWAIFTGKLLFMKGSGIAELNSALDLLEANATNTVYTLKVFETLQPKQVKSKSEEDGGFNFYLNADSMGITVGQHRRLYGSGSNEMITAMAAINKRLDDMQADKDQPSKLGMLGEVLDHPVLGTILEKIALKFVDQMLPGGTGTNAVPAALPMRAVGNLATDTELVQALEKLKQYDPQLTEHLKKLAIMAEHDQATWSIIISALDKM